MDLVIYGVLFLKFIPGMITGMKEKNLNEFDKMFDFHTQAGYN